MKGYHIIRLVTSKYVGMFELVFCVRVSCLHVIVNICCFFMFVLVCMYLIIMRMCVFVCVHVHTYVRVFV